MPRFAALEAGGTKFVCGVGSGPGDLRTVEFPTTQPAETIDRCIEFFRHEAGTGFEALGIGAFGPVNLAAGRITSTPKADWRDCDLAGPFRSALGVPVMFQTDVNAALSGEVRWGAAQGVEQCLYLSVGTGIGGAALMAGQLAGGASHPEMGHIRIPHLPEDAGFAGVCPFHGDCLEGLASGPAIAARTGYPGERLPADHPVWQMEAQYLALGIASLVCILSPALCILGGGVMQQPGLLEMIHPRLRLLLNGYVPLPLLVRPRLGVRAGVLGALALAGA